MATTTKLTLLLLFCASFQWVSAQIIEESFSDSYTYTFEVENILTGADEATVKEIKTYSKDFFETHPEFTGGFFKVTTGFPVEEERVREHLEMYGFTVSSFKIEKDILATPKTEEQ